MNGVMLRMCEGRGIEPFGQANLNAAPYRRARSAARRPIDACPPPNYYGKMGPDLGRYAKVGT